MEMITRRRHTNYRLDEPLLPTTVPYKQQTIPWQQNAAQPFPLKSNSASTQGQSCRDRTSEFFSAVRSLQSRRSNHFMPMPPNRPRSEFTLKARCIGKDLANTVCKLEKLTLLVGSQHMSSDPVEIGELTVMINQDIKGLNKQIAALQELAQTQKYHRSNHLQTHSNSIVITLQSRLATMSNDFKFVLETRSENLKQEKLPQTPQLYRRTDAHPRKNLFIQEDQQEDLVINMDSSEPQRQQNQVLLEEQSSHYQERADTMESIETTIVELGSVFQRLATMVKEQEEQVHRIDSNINDADINIEAAHSELLKYLQYVSSNRTLVIKIFVVLIVFFIVFIKFLA